MSWPHTPAAALLDLISGDAVVEEMSNVRAALHGASSASMMTPESKNSLGSGGSPLVNG
jgi:hypothetical protein